ncbi:hypothetical protein [Mangrovihabitans endophyticus]|uniref:Uncharacterized protein n=1 Tax=Mangrovihabitans endophyticus TaxID=1751298 RepID=A0A8J3BYJ0_9ACTN|nr:hypothetical protein [Mangrovihabitans endophyticus]GGK82717.1 hypothetical protein GCM10012284_15900 [Mangrovihabitans endophyticus]
MTDQQTKTRFPAPLYAAAGAGDMAVQQLRKLPGVVGELSGRAAVSLGSANARAVAWRERAASTDLDELRTTATTGAVAFVQLASDRAVAAYTALVARGERVVGTGVVEAADVVNADMTATEEPKAVAAAEAQSAPKPRKRTTKSASTQAN